VAAVALALAAAALSLVGAQAATAAEVAGDPCVADAAEPGVTMIGLNNQTSEPFMQPMVPPEGSWIITRWRVQVAAGIGPIAQQLVVSHQRGEESDQKTGESAIESLVPGTNEFATRLPASEYDHVGLNGPVETLVCHHQMNVAGRVANPFPVGEERHLELLVHVGVPVVVALERDADDDGYGDETQDQCPWLASAHENCAAISLSTHPKVTKQALWLEIRTGSPALAEVRGSIAWPRADHRGRTVVKLATVHENVPFEGTAVVKLPLSKSVKRHLAKLPRKQSVQASLTIIASDERRFPAFAPANQTLRVKLPGRRKQHAG
jgi:hypothetical protein